MAIGRTARGTANGASTDGSGAYQLAAAVTVGATGSTLVIALGFNAGDYNADLSWNGQTMTHASSAEEGVGDHVEVYVLDNATAATGSVVVDDSLSGGMGKWVMIAVEVTGAATASFDKHAEANGLSGSPSSGSTATTSQANEMLLGFIVRNTATVDGSWSGSFSAGQSATRTLFSFEEGYCNVTATGAYAAAKTGATSAVWVATIVTFKEGALAPTSATIGMSVTATLPQAGRANALAIGMTTTATTPQPHGVDALKIGASVIASLEQPGRTGSLALSSMEVTAEMGEPVASLSMLFPPPEVAVPLVVLTAPQVSQAASIGVRSDGRPYNAAWMDSTAPYHAIVGGGEIALRVVMAIYEAPRQLNSAQEPHYLASVHKIGGDELYSIGVTPDLRLCAWTGGMGLLLSSPGVVVADGSFHQYELALIDGNTLSVDGVPVAYLKAPGFSQLASDGPLRVMAFNGVAGTTRCACAIMRIEISTENNGWAWAFSEGVGTQISGGELSDPDLPGVDWTLRFGWYDPRPTYPLSYGAVPTGRFGLEWLLSTKFRRMGVVRPNYRTKNAGDGGFRPSEIGDNP